MQTLLPQFRHIPRVIFTALAFIISTVAGVAGRSHFSAILNNFLAVVSDHSESMMTCQKTIFRCGSWRTGSHYGS